MREGRRRRLGLLTGTEGTVGDTYLDRILGDVDVAGETNILNLDPDANVRTTDQRYLQDAYNYYLGGGYDASQDDFPIQAEDITGGQTLGTGAGDAAQIPGAIDTLVAPDTRPPEFVTGITGGTDIDPYTPGIMEDEYDVDTIQDYSGVRDSKRLDARGATEMGTRPPDFVAGAQTFIDPDPGSEGNIKLMSRADVTPEIQTVAGPFDYLQDEPVELGPVDPGVTNPRVSPLALARADSTTMVDPAEEISRAPMDPTMMIPQVPPYTDRIMDPELMDIQQQNFETLPTEEKTNIIQDAWNKAQEMGGDLKSNFQENLMGTGKFSLPQLGSFIQTVMNPSSWSVAGALGIPGMILGGIGQALGAIPQYEPTFEERTLEEEIGVTEDGKFSGDPTESAFAGLNAVSTFGDPVETAKDRIEERLDTIENNPDISEEFKNDTETMIEEWEAVTDKIGDVESPIDTLGDTEVSLTQRFADQAAAEKAEADRAMQEQIATAEAAQAQAAKIEAARRALQVINAPQVGGGNGGGYQGGGGQAAADVAGGSWGYSPFRKGGRVGYGKGGIVDLLK